MLLLKVGLIVFGVLGGGYWMLHRLEHAGERAQERARVRLQAFYTEVNGRAMRGFWGAAFQSVCNASIYRAFIKRT